jgi:stearoyl-CoA 9-desaturase NADPH oxidoreductase
MKNVSAGLRARLVDLASLVATPLVPSHYIALLRPLAATHARVARVEAVHDETADTRTLLLRPGRGWRPHVPGQHVRVSVAIGGRLATRTYSMSSAPRRDGCFTITVKAQGRVSNALVRDVPVGSYLSIGLPEGDFVLPPALPAQLAFVTGGSGITPVMSMLRHLAERGELRDVVHLHYARHAQHVIFGDELRALAAGHPGYRLVLVLGGADPRLLDDTALDEHIPDWRERQTWLCGPRGMLDAATDCFARAGRTAALHVERFMPALAQVPANATGGNVRFAASGTERRSDGRTPLLRVAEEAGVQAPHGCRMGICHTCDATLLKGCVRDLRTGEQIAEPGTRIQVCVCAAAGDVELAL